MLGHYLLTALRNIACNKVASSINIVCLSVGLLCLLAVYAAVAYLQHSDARFPNAERTFALTQKTYSPGSHAAMATVPQHGRNVHGM